MIKILNIITRLNIGGASIHVLQLSQLFHNENYSSTVLYGNVEANEQDMLYLAKEYDFPLLNLPAMGRSLNPLLDLKLIWQIYRVIKTQKPDIVHTHTAKAGFAGRIAARLAGVPVILHTFHGNNFQGYFGKLMSTVSIVTERLLARISTRIIAISDLQRKDLLRYRIAKPGKIAVIRLGFDLAKIQAGPGDKGQFKASWNIRPEQPLLLFVGRLTAIKNPFQLLRIAAKVLAARPDAVFAYVGDGELAADLKAEVARLGFQDRVIFTGFQQNLKPAYADADILLLTSLNEGTPVAIVEAMANRVLVIASKVGGIPDLISPGKNGLLCAASDISSFASSILSYLAEPAKYAAMKDSALADIKRDFSLERLESEFEALIRNLL